jgi:hypothetical protein
MQQRDGTPGARCGVDAIDGIGLCGGALEPPGRCRDGSGLPLFDRFDAKQARALGALERVLRDGRTPPRLRER